MAGIATAHRSSFVARSLAALSAGCLIVLSGCGAGTFTSGTGGSGGSVVTVTVSGAASTRLGTTSQFSATVANSTSQAVTWKVNGITGGSTATGTISATGLYTAPSTVPSQNPITISAVSVATPTASGTFSEAIWNPVPTLTTETAIENGLTTSFLLDVQGTGFVPGATIEVSGTPVATTYVSATELQATYSVPSSGTALVTVMNPNPGSALSPAAAVQFTIYKATVPQAARLLDQATFGPTAADIQHVQTVGLDAYITEQLTAPPTLLPAITVPPPTICATNLIPCEQSEWWQAALTANDQLRQRVAFALSEIFVVFDKFNQLKCSNYVPERPRKRCLWELPNCPEGRRNLDRDGRLPEHAEQQQTGQWPNRQ